jgi:hypothetical protein
VLTGLSKGAELMTQGLIQGAKELKNIIDSIEKGEVPGTEGTKIDQVGDALTGAATGAAAGAMIGAVGGPLAAAVGAALGGLTGAAIGWFDSQKGNATGGIVSGPKDGYAVKVHGTELIVPLTESNRIKKDTEGLGLLKNMLKDDMSVISDGESKSTNLSSPAISFASGTGESKMSTIANQLSESDSTKVTSQFSDKSSPEQSFQTGTMNFSELVQKFESLEKAFNMQISKSNVTNELLSEHSDYLRNILRASQ